MEALILIVVVSNFLIGMTLDILNQKNILKPWPEEVRGIFTQAQVKRVVAYSRENFQLTAIRKIISTALVVLMIAQGGFNVVNDWAISITPNERYQSLLFLGVLMCANQLIALPFRYVHTFIIEEKYGFNTMTRSLFIKDTLKSVFIGGLLGGVLLFIFGFLLNELGDDFWFFFWLIMVVVMVLINMFATSLIIPLFNKLTPIENEDLKGEILDYCKKVGYKLTNLYQMDGSKRSKKANAFFSGFGPRKSVVLYDTLINGQTNNEIVAVLAHEIGHYKKKHTLFNLMFGISQLFGILWLLGWSINQPELSLGLGVLVPKFYTGLIAFFILFSPVSFVIGMFQSILSRKMEYQADAYAAETYDGEKLIDALKKLSVDNLSNLNPHPAYVFFNYSHPPIHKRIKAIRN